MLEINTKDKNRRVLKINTDEYWKKRIDTDECWRSIQASIEKKGIDTDRYGGSIQTSIGKRLTQTSVGNQYRRALKIILT